MNLSTQLLTMVHISRPRFWLYLIGPVLVGGIIGTPSLYQLANPAFLFLLLLSSFPLNLILYGINDLMDHDTDRLNPKKINQEHLLRVHQRSHLARWLIGSTAAVIITAALLLPPMAILMLILFLILSIGYSSPPLRFKARPFLDSWSNVLYLLPGVTAFYLYSNHWPSTAVIIAAAAWTTGMHLYSAIPDIFADRQAGIKTTAVLLGRNASLALATCYWMSCALILTTSYPSQTWLMLLFFYPVITLSHVLFPQISIEKMYWYFPALNATLGFGAFWVIAIEKML